MKKSVCVFGVLCGTLFSPSFASAQLTSPTPEPFTAECRSFLKALPADVIRGFVLVPENRMQPAGKQLRVFYYGRLSGGGTPVLFLNGGPGESSHSSFGVAEKIRAQQSEQQRIPFLFVDQRGTGCSSLFPEAISPATVFALTFYGSRDIVEDAEAVRRQVQGNQRWSIFGHSYGGNIVVRYVTLHPESLTSAFSFGGAMLGDVADMRSRALKQQRNWAEYLRQYPGDDLVIDDLHRSIPSDHCLVVSGTRVCGSVALDNIASGLGFTQFWPLLHEALRAIALAGTNKTAAYDQFVMKYSSGALFSPMPETIISWRDMQNGVSDAALMRATRESLLQDGIAVDDWKVSELRLTMNLANAGLEKLIAQLPKNRVDPLSLSQAAASLRRYPRLHLTLFGGSEDALVPPETLRRAAAEFRASGVNVPLILIPGEGHNGAARPEVLSYIARTIRNGG